MLEIIEFLHYKKNIYHRDIKVDNFVLDADFNLKLIDFGFATDINELTLYEKGTKMYTPPEAYLNKKYLPSD